MTMHRNPYRWKMCTFLGFYLTHPPQVSPYSSPLLPFPFFPHLIHLTLPLLLSSLSPILPHPPPLLYPLILTHHPLPSSTSLCLGPGPCGASLSVQWFPPGGVRVCSKLQASHAQSKDWLQASGDDGLHFRPWNDQGQGWQRHAQFPFPPLFFYFSVVAILFCPLGPLSLSH